MNDKEVIGYLERLQEPEPWEPKLSDKAYEALEIAIDRMNSPIKKEFAVNLNDLVKVKLTDWGKEIYYHKNDKVNKTFGRRVIKPSFPRVDSEGYAKFQLWDFINIYGNYMGICDENVIEPLDIIVCK